MCIFLDFIVLFYISESLIIVVVILFHSYLFVVVFYCLVSCAMSPMVLEKSWKILLHNWMAYKCYCEFLDVCRLD